jgi:hypothetical protein
MSVRSGLEIVVRHDAQCQREEDDQSRPNLDGTIGRNPADAPIRGSKPRDADQGTGDPLVRRFREPHAARRKRELIGAINEFSADGGTIELHEIRLDRRRTLLSVDRREPWRELLVDPEHVLREVSTLAERHGFDGAITDHRDCVLAERTQRAFLFAGARAEPSKREDHRDLLAQHTARPVPTRSSRDEARSSECFSPFFARAGVRTAESPT